MWQGGSHARADCEELIALKAKNNGKLPEHYKGAREIAFEMWRGNQKKRFEARKDPKGGHQKALHSDRDTDNDDIAENQFKGDLSTRNELLQCFMIPPMMSSHLIH